MMDLRSPLPGSPLRFRLGVSIRPNPLLVKLPPGERMVGESKFQELYKRNLLPLQPAIMIGTCQDKETPNLVVDDGQGLC